MEGLRKLARNIHLETYALIPTHAEFILVFVVLYEFK